MKKIKTFKQFNEVLTESNLSRIYKHILEHDCACITAFRGHKVNCLKSIDDKPEGGQYTRQEKLQRNHKLYSMLMGFNYGVTRIDGTFIENFGNKDLEKEVKENTFFIVNLKNDPKFIENVINLGKHFCQDSVLIKEKNSEQAYLYGTNNMLDESGKSMLNTKTPVGLFHGGIKSLFMSKIRNRPFAFFEDGTFYNLLTRGYIFEKSKNEFLRQV